MKVGSAEYLAAYKHAIGMERHDSGKFREVINAYLESPRFKGLKPRTQSDMRTSIFHESGIDAEFGKFPIAAVENPRMLGRVISWRDKKWKPGRTADMRTTHMVTILNWAVKNGKLQQHHVKGIEKTYRGDRSHITWSKAEIEAMSSEAVPEYVRRVILAAYHTGLAPGDLARVRLSEHVHKTPEGRRILIERSKTGESQGVPVSDELAGVIDTTPSGQDFLIVQSSGAPFADQNYISKAILPWRRRMGVRDELNLYDLRGTRATELLNSGLDLGEMALTMGWSVDTASKIVERYARVDPAITDRVASKVRASKKPAPD